MFRSSPRDAGGIGQNIVSSRSSTLRMPAVVSTYAIWERVESWLRVNSPTVLESLRPGASDEEIAAAEAFLGVRLPSDVADSYRIHDGQQQGASAPSLIEGWSLLSLADVRNDWGDVWKFLHDRGEYDGLAGEPQGPIKPVWYNPRWIPITSGGDGNHHMLDLDPDEGGQSGQIIVVWHDDPTRELVAPSFTEWFDRFARDLEAGRYVPSHKYGGIVPRCWL